MVHLPLVSHITGEEYRAGSIDLLRTAAAA